MIALLEQLELKWYSDRMTTIIGLPCQITYGLPRNKVVGKDENMCHSKWTFETFRRRRRKKKKNIYIYIYM